MLYEFISKGNNRSNFTLMMIKCVDLNDFIYNNNF